MWDKEKAFTMRATFAWMKRIRAHYPVHRNKCVMTSSQTTPAAWRATWSQGEHFWRKACRRPTCIVSNDRRKHDYHNTHLCSLACSRTFRFATDKSTSSLSAVCVAKTTMIRLERRHKGGGKIACRLSIANRCLHELIRRRTDIETRWLDIPENNACVDTISASVSLFGLRVNLVVKRR